MKYPAELYATSPRKYRGLSELRYPFHDRTITVTRCGRICPVWSHLHGSAQNQLQHGQNIGVRQVADKIWLASFMDYDLGFLITRHAASNRLRTRSRLKCYPCPPV